MEVLITGGAGFIGSHVVDLLVERNHGVSVIDNLDPQVHGANAAVPRHLEGHLKAGTVRFVRGEITDRKALAEALERAEAVVHLAAAVGVGQSMYEPYYYVHANCAGTALLLEMVLAGRERVHKLVVASSMSLYGEGAYACPACGGTSGRERDESQLGAGRWEVRCAACDADLAPVPTPETKPPVLASVYAATKKHQEDLFVCFGTTYRIPTFALRFFNVFGPRQSLNNPYTGVAAIFLSRLLNDRPPLVFEDGRQSRDFIHVRDVARAVVLSVEQGGAGAHVLNVGTGKSTTVGQVAVALATHLGKDIAPHLVQRYRAGDVRHCFADPARTNAVLGFRAEVPFEAGLADLIDWCRDQRPQDGVDASFQRLQKEGLVR